MKRRLFTSMTTLVAAVGFSAAVLSSPAGAAGNSTVVATVFDASTNAAWAGGVTGATAYDTAVVTPDVSSPAGGTLTYSFFTNDGGCTGTPTTTQDVTLNSDGTVPHSTPTAALGAGVDSFEAVYNGDGTNDPSLGDCQAFIVGQATPTVGISNVPSSGAFGGGFTATVVTNGDGTTSVASNSASVCTVSGFAVTYVGIGTCSLTASVTAGTNFTAASGSAQTIPIGQATPSVPTISDLPVSGTFGGGFTATVTTTGDGTTSIASNSTGVCTVSGFTVTYVGVGTCSLTASVTAGTHFSARVGTPQTFTVGRATPTAPTVTNLPTGAAYLGSFMAAVTTNGDGVTTVATNSPSVCTVGSNGVTVSFVGIGTCSLTAKVAQGPDYLAANGLAQTFAVGRATPTSPVVGNLPANATEFGKFVASVVTNGDGATSVTSNSTGVCTVGADGHTVTFVGFGVCTLTAGVGDGTLYLGATGSPQSFPVGPAARGYWLVGSDGGIFSFGAAAFHGSTGAMTLQRPVVGITPSASRQGYWLVASDGGIFSFGDTAYFGSVPGVGLHPAGSGQPSSLQAPIVGVVPSTSGHGYFMVASDGGVFAFGDARYAGSCPSIGGCHGAAVSVMPDSTGKGYWLVTDLGSVYAFGDATYYGAPAPQTVPVVDAVATPDGHGYWLLYANGLVSNFGDATNFGSPLGYVNSFNPATSIYPTADGKGYWVAAARGDVFAYGDSPYLGSMAAAGLNGEIIAAFGF